MGVRAEVLLGDCRDVLATLADASVDAVVTDPPYGLTQVSRGGSPRQIDTSKPYGRHRLADKGFMGQQWDNGREAHDPAFWAEVLRVAKPGAFLLAFGGTRTYHRLACAIEDAGWDLRDMIVHWMYATGFPKSKSCLKPSHEPILLAKAPGPLRPLQIDACRLPTGDGLGRPKGTHNAFPFSDDSWGNGPLTHTEGHSGGRWPPNTLFSHHPDCQPAGVRRVRGSNVPGPRGLAGRRENAWGWRAAPVHVHNDADGYETVDAWTCVDGCPVAALDRQAGPRPSSPGSTRGASRRIYGHGAGFTDATGEPIGYRDASPAVSRFFPTFGPDPADAVPFRYQPKAPARERRLADGTPTGHPTQKPVALAQWLASLVCAPGGTILDPFAGVGSLGLGALRAGCHYLGIEQDAAYARVAQRRLDEEQEQRAGPLFAGVGTATTAAR